jgi:hypothetical protein
MNFIFNDNVRILCLSCNVKKETFLVPCSYVTAEGADKNEIGTNVTRTTKKTPWTTFMKGEEWRLFLSFLFKSDKFSIIF